MQTPQDLLKTIAEHLQGSAHVRNVYGEPVTAGDRTIIPVARLGYGFGAGGGGKEERAGGGGGGGMGAQPVGVVEITPAGTRFIRFGDMRQVAAAAALGLVAGLVLGRRRRR